MSADPYVIAQGTGFKFTGTVATWIVVLAGLALYLPDLARPFGPADINAVLYLGPFAQIWETFGWTATRGMPIAPQMIHEVGGGWPYMQHPPGWLWLGYLSGTSEAGLRFLTTLAAILAAVALLHLLRDLTWPFALGAALALLGMPVLRVYTQVSLEPGVLAFGLMFLLATARVIESSGRTRRRWRLLQILCGFIGPWCDWPFAWYCAGILALLPWQDKGRAGKELLLAAIPVLISVVLILVWRAWAFGHPAYPGAGATQGTISSLFESTVLKRPPLDVWLEGCTRCLLIGNTTLIPLLAIPGLVLLLARRITRGPVLAMLIAGLLHPLILAHHATFHVHFYLYLCPALVAGCAAYGICKAVLLRRLGAVLMVIVVLTSWSQSGAAMQRNHTTLFRDFGRAMSEAIEDTDAPDSNVRRFLVATNFEYPCPYYLKHAEAVGMPITDPVLLEAHRQHTPYAGIRFLWVKVTTTDDNNAHGRGMTNEALETYLAPFPRRRLPELEREYYTPGAKEPRRIDEVWLYDLLR